MMIRVLLIVLGGVAVAWSVRQWRLAIQAAMLLLVLEGAIRKWLLPGAQDLVYFAKDALFLGAYLGYFRSRARRAAHPQAPLLYATLAFGAALGLLEVFNPKLPNLLVGLLGFKSYFLYVPLLFVVPAVFPDDAALARFLQRYMLIVFPVVMLSIAQFFSPAGSILNTYAQPTDVASISTFGSSKFVRTTGTFSYISGYTAYLLTTTLLIMIILTTTRWRFRGNLVVYAALGTTLLGIMMSGSRGPIFLLALVFPLYWWLAVVREKQSGRTFVRLLVGLGLLVAGLRSAGEEAVTAFSQRASGSQDVGSRLTAPFESPVDMLPYAGLLGYGIGATHQAAAALTGGVENTWLGTVVPESESGRVMLELGPVGFFFVYLARMALALFAFRQALRLRTTFHRAVATSVLLFLLIQIPGGTVFDVTTGVYYWFLGGLVFLVVRLDRQAVASRQTSLAPPRPVVPLTAPANSLRSG
ncbi:MAG TPA: hypothetical protein VGS07_02780 [Thermoanaerobaculia bacterium]|jgi:hypothetical protein|nr:hypothetical protein [Thermoanaerobaculia bacterium]